MSAGLSTYLNVLRFGAALVVLLSHFAYPRFSDGAWLWVRELNLGSDAVVVFFVLSGFVIALTVDRKDRDFGAFLFARGTRLISVAMPGLILGWWLDQWGNRIASEQYFQPYYEALPLWEMLLRGLSFSNEWQGFAARLGSNGPYWSLSYEVAYYVLFGVAVYMTGWRRGLLLVAGGVLFGLNILLLMPAWLLGVWLYHRLKRGWDMSLAQALLYTCLPVGFYGLALMWNLPDYLKLAIQPQFGGHALRFSDEYLWNTILAGLVCLHLAGMAALTKAHAPKRQALWAWLAAASFSIYLAHYPLLQFLHAALPELGHGGLFTLTLVACFVFAELFERPLHLWRRVLGWAIPRAVPA